MERPVEASTSEKTDIYLLAGFLGSGKTTLLNRILAWETDLSDTVVIVNEFGKIGIDGSIIKSKSGGRDVIELTSGCICCTLTDELVNTLADIRERFKPRRILLEATGVAEPESIAELIEAEPLRDYMRIEKIVTVLGIKYWLGRETFGPFFMSQVEQADLILLNKIDTVSQERLHTAVADLRAEVPGCPVLPTLQCKVDPEVFWSRQATTAPPQKLGNFYTSLPVSAVDPDNDDASGQERISYDTFDFVSEQPLDAALFEGFLKTLPWQLFRIKGPVRFHDRTALLNYVAGQADWQEWEVPDHTRLAFIGWDIDAEVLQKKLGECVAH